MKVTFCSYPGVMLVRGGPAVKIIELQRALRELNVKIDLFDPWGPAEETLEADIFQVFAANLATFDLVRKLRERNRTIVVNPIFYTRRPWWTVRCISALDLFLKKYFRGLWWDYGFVRDICHWANGLWPNTQAEATLLHRALGISRDRMRVIPNGVSERFLHADPELFIQKYGWKDFILNVGHVGPDRKNTLRLVKALIQIDHPAVIIGRAVEGGETAEVLSLLQKAPHILFINGLDHDSELLASAYAASRVFVLPSKFETPGRAALEAALAGANIVITPFGGTREYFLNYAEYVNPYSVESIRQGIERALAKPASSQLRNHIQAHYLWPIVAKQLKAFYQEILGQQK